MLSVATRPSGSGGSSYVSSSPLSGIGQYFTGFEDLEQRLIELGYGDRVGANYWNKLQYNESASQKLLSSLGFRTGADTFWENARMQYGEYLSGLMAEAKQNEYNTPSEQASRMRQAGQNPDLLGTGDVANAVAPAEDTNNTLPENISGTVEEMASFLAGIGGFFSQALSMAGSFQQLSSGRLALKQQRIALEDQGISFADHFLISHTPEEFPEWNPEAEYVDSDGNVGRVGDYFSDAASYMRSKITDAWKEHKSRYGGYVKDRDWQQIDKYISHMVNSLPTTSEQYAAWRKQAEDKLAYGQARDSEFYATEFNELRKANMEYRKSLDEVMKIVADLQKHQSSAGIAEADYNKALYDSMDGSTMGQYQMQSAGQQVQAQGLQIEGLGYENALKRINKIAEEAKNRLIDRWTEMADQGSVFANFMLWQYSLDT